jgi:uncharacterized membrane protein YidH (DUF202 family)
MPGTPPAQPKIYHIVHVDRLPSIIGDGRLLCDSQIIKTRAGHGTTIGMSSIKSRRLGLPVHCHSGLNVGDFVPFYFCPRSIMLYVINCANHPELAYKGGQGPIVHLVADLRTVVAWARTNKVKWAFSLSNAGAAYTQFRNELKQLGEVNWDAVAASDFRPAEVKEGKQAEFLVQGGFPWELVEEVGAINQAMATQAAQAIQRHTHRPVVQVRRGWYY